MRKDLNKNFFLFCLQTDKHKVEKIVSKSYRIMKREILEYKIFADIVFTVFCKKYILFEII